ncbi:hypothetical protein MRX96_053690 [Rhipicephalus microplus]
MTEEHSSPTTRAHGTAVFPTGACLTGPVKKRLASTNNDAKSHTRDAREKCPITPRYCQHHVTPSPIARPSRAAGVGQQRTAVAIQSSPKRGEKASPREVLFPSSPGPVTRVSSSTCASRELGTKGTPRRGPGVLLWVHNALL